MKTDWTGEYYLGMTLKWDYNKIHNDRIVCLSMPGYVRDALIQFQHAYTKRAPLHHHHIKHQSTDENNKWNQSLKPPPLQKNYKKNYKKYARAIDNTMMHALNDLASQITTDKETFTM